MFQPAVSGIIGYFIAQKILKNKAKSGKIPVLNPDDLHKKQAHPLSYGIRNYHWINLAAVTGYIVLMFSLPVIFYFSQKYYLTTPDTLYLDITVSAILSFFASIGGAFILMQIIMYLDKKDVIKDAIATNQIVLVNNVHYIVPPNTYNWKQIITQEQVNEVKRAQQKSAKKWLIFAVLISIPLYVGLFLTYTKITSHVITESIFGEKQMTSLSQVEKVTAKLSIRNSNNTIPQAEPSLVIKIFAKNNQKVYEICGPECYSNHKNVYNTLIAIADSSKATFEAEPAPEYLQRFLLQEKKEYLLELNELVLDLAKRE